VEILEDMSTPVELKDRDSLLKSASTSLNSKVGIAACPLSPPPPPTVAYMPSELSDVF